MAVVVGMPKLSDTMEEGAVANWIKKEGDKVDEGGPLVEIETDKATMEYQSPADGVVLKILLQPGKTVALDTPIAVVGKPGESFDLDSVLKAGAARKAEPSKADAKSGKAEPAKAEPANAESAKSAGATPAAKSQPEGRLRSSPLARKMAAAQGVDLSRIVGSGPGGRIVAKDITGGAAAGSAMRALPRREDRSVPVSLMRKTIAKRLLAGKNDAPHFYLTRSVDVGRLLEFRTRLNAGVDEAKGGVKVSVNDLVILATADALRRHPNVNASWQGEHIVEYGAVHMAVAVALPQGLVTPVIRNADQIGVRAIAQSTRALVQKAKAGQLTNEDYAGGTFTISNLGMFGIEEFTAIINPPQAAILAVGASVATPVVDSNGQIVVQQRMKITLSCDHRVVDGAMGAMFLQTLVANLEDPAMMLALSVS